MNSYKITLDLRYLVKAERYADKLIEIGKRDKGGLFFPYEFDFKLHGGSDEMKTPWYSGMAQGTALSFFSVSYEITKEEKFLIGIPL